MWRATILIACLSVTGCDDAPKKPAAAQVKDAAEAERLKQEREAAAARFRASPAEAIETAIAGWMTVRDGVVIVPDGFSTPQRKREGLAAMPLGLPWYVTCGRRGLFVSIGPWSEMESSGRLGATSGPLFQLQITQTMLAEAECPDLVVLTAQNMRRRRLLQPN